MIPLPEGGGQARLVQSLDIESLPEGAISRLFVELVQDGMGNPLAVPVLVARGRRPGPVFGLTAAVHGNELNGIPVIHRIFERLDVSTLRGTLVAIIVINVPGFLMNLRTFNSGTDLNRIMPGRAHGNESEVYVHRLISRIVRHFQTLIDLHTASFGRINSLYVRANMTERRTAQMAYLQRPQIILHIPPSDRTLRGTVQEMGIPAITVEMGNPQRLQQEYIRSSIIGIRSVLAELGMIPRRRVTPGPPPILCESSKWLYTETGGLLEVFPEVTQFVRKDQLLARVTNVFGDVVAEVHSPLDGVVIGKSSNPVASSGARILHLGKVAPSGWPVL